MIGIIPMKWKCWTMGTFETCWIEQKDRHLKLSFGDASRYDVMITCEINGVNLYLKRLDYTAYGDERLQWLIIADNVFANAYEIRTRLDLNEFIRPYIC